jgi:hypothetical protein
VNARRSAGLGIFLLVGALAAASALAASLPHREQLNALYRADHRGASPKSDAELAPYAAPFQRILALCTINSPDLATATLYMANHVSKQPGASGVTNLTMVTAISQRITWTAPKDCWDMFNTVQARMAASAAAKLIVNRHQLGSLYGFDHYGLTPPDASALLPYSTAFETIYTRCLVSLDDLPTQVIALSEKASELGGRTVTALAMMHGIMRRIIWKGRQDCAAVFENAEVHMESGGP